MFWILRKNIFFFFFLWNTGIMIDTKSQTQESRNLKEESLTKRLYKKEGYRIKNSLYYENVY